jgi:hypothetical protein
VIGTPGDRPDQLGFIAGVIAAMVSPDWRAGVISLSDTIDGRSARTGFLNGVNFFCGLCLPIHPPVYEYPLYFELPSAPGRVAKPPIIWSTITETVYVYPVRGMKPCWPSAGAGVISSAAGNLLAVASNWVVSTDTDPLPLIQELVGSFLNGRLPEGEKLSVPYSITHQSRDIYSR